MGTKREGIRETKWGRAPQRTKFTEGVVLWRLRSLENQADGEEESEDWRVESSGTNFMGITSLEADSKPSFTRWLGGSVWAFRSGLLLEFWRGSGTFDLRVLAGAGWDFQLTLGWGLDDKKQHRALA